MRKVKFEAWDAKKKEWYRGEGYFHQWASSYEEFENGPGNYTIAIVEDPQGKVYEIMPHHLQFLDLLTTI